MENEVKEPDYPPSKRTKLDTNTTENDANETDFTQDVIDIDSKDFTVNTDSYKDIVPPEELERLREFKVLDETKSNEEDSRDEDSDSSDGRPIDDDEIEKMLEENLPEGFKKAPKPKERAYYTVSRTVLEEKGVNHFEVLPLDWMMIQHYSGMPIYLHKTTRVCTLSKPYFLGKGNARRHEIPLSAIPCLAYRRALEEEEKQKEIDRRIEEQVRNQNMENNQQNENFNVNEQASNEAVNKVEINKDTRLSKTYFSAVCDRKLLGNIKGDNKALGKDFKCPYGQSDGKQLNDDQKDVTLSNTDKLCDDIDNIKNDGKIMDKSAIFSDNIKSTLMQGDECKDLKAKYPYSLKGTNVTQHIIDISEKNTKYSDIGDYLNDSNVPNTNDILEKSENNLTLSVNKVKDVNISLWNNRKMSAEMKTNNENINALADFNEIDVIDKCGIVDKESILNTKNDQQDPTTEATESKTDPENGESIKDLNIEATNSVEDKNSKGNFDDISLSRRPVTLPGGIVMAPPRVETVSSSLKTLTPEQLNDYCKNLFKFKVVKILHFKRWADRRKYNKARKTLQYPALSEGTKLITIPMQHMAQNGGRPSKRDWVMSMNGGSYLSVFHEYVGRALQKQPVYEFKNLENASTPYQATVYIGGMQYGVGYGSSKRQAKAAAARASVHILIPEMKDELDAHDARGANANKDDTDFSFFDHVGIEDPRIMDFCAATCEPSPHAILKTCLLRNFGTDERHIHIEMKKSEYQKIELTMKVGKHTATVACKNKKTAKQRAAQAILQALHPHVRSWGSLLRLYGSKSVKSCKEKKLEEQQITLLQDKARHNEPNYAVLEKLKSEMLKLKERDAAFVPIGTFLLTDSLPSHSNSDLNYVDL